MNVTYDAEAEALMNEVLLKDGLCFSEVYLCLQDIEHMSVMNETD